MTPIQRHVIITLACAAAIGSGALTLYARQAQTRDGQTARRIIGTAQLSGVVVADGEIPARPIRRAIVTITGTGIATSWQILTDDNGRFAFTNLPAGRFSLTAEKPVYLNTYYGNSRVGRAPGMPIALESGQQLTTLNIPLSRGAIVSGRVTDEAGVAIAGAQVQLTVVTMVNGERRTAFPSAGTGIVTTDDRGAYRAYGLSPGEYLVRAIGGGGFSAGGQARLMTPEDLTATTAPAVAAQTVTRAGTYYPDAIDVDAAQTIALGAGDDREDINIVNRFSHAVRVSGMAIDPDGRPLQSASLGLANLSQGRLWSSQGAILVRDGQFSVSSLTAGRWMIFGGGADPGTPSDGKFPWWAETEFVIGDQDLTGVVLHFERGATVRGRMVFRGGTPPQDLSRVRVSLTSLPTIASTGGSVQPVVPNADGTFVFTGVPPGKYRVSMSPAGSWTLRSATTSTTDLDTLDTPLAIAPGENVTLTLTLIDQPTEVTGVLFDQLDRPAPEYSVVMFSADRAMWTTSPRRTSGVVRLGSDGAFKITGLPPGDYFLSVVTDIEPGQLGDTAFLDLLSRSGVRITLGEGGKRQQNLKMGAGGDWDGYVSRTRRGRRTRRRGGI